MKFKELREADLSKAQIKKVHDKADDLPKNDFIKRYGKDGDSVRFATATKMVKKELGIDEKSTEDKLKKWGPVKQLPPLKGAKLGKPVKAEYEEESVKEEAELTENISGEVVAKGYAKTIAQMTDRNDHFGARKYIANLIKDKQLANMYDMLDQMHSLTNGAGNHAISLRSRLEQILKYRVGKKLRPDIAKIILGGL